MRIRLALWAMVFLISVLSSQEAAAQQATSFEQLQVLVKVGDTISVTDSTGQVSKGKIAGLSPSSLQLLVNGLTRDLVQNDVLEIKQRRGDPLKNGAKIGALAGLGFGTLGAIVVCTHDYEDSCPGFALAAIGFYTGAGAAIGVGIDAMIIGQRTVYRGQPRAARFNLRPYISAQRRGVQLSVSF